MRWRSGRIMGESTSALSIDELLSEHLGPVRSGELVQTLDESALIERCLAGDETAFDQIVERYQDMVFGLAFRFLGNRDEAVELSQEVFLQIYRKLDTFRKHAALRTWIYRIVINQAKNKQRWWRRRFKEMTAISIDDLQETVRGTPVGLSLASNDELPDETLERKEIGELLRKAIESLPFAQRSVIVLKDMEGLSYEEIALTLDIPVGTVKSRLARSRQALKQVLDPAVFGFSLTPNRGI